MKDRVYQPKTDLRNNSPLQLYMKSKLVFVRMKDNPNFPDPFPTMSDFSQAINKLQTAMMKAQTTLGGIHNRDVAVKELSIMYRRLASYVRHVSGGDPAIILTSGFGVNKKKANVYITEAPMIKPVKKSHNEGSVKLSWTVIPKSTGYVIRLYDVTQTDIEIGHFNSTKTNIILSGLESGKKYMVRVSARGRRGEGPMSNAMYIWENWM